MIKENLKKDFSYIQPSIHFSKKNICLKTTLTTQGTNQYDILDSIRTQKGSNFIHYFTKFIGNLGGELTVS